jgi:hypothetical protein
MQRRVHMARLGIALIAFANATAALTVPKAFAATSSGAPAAIELASRRGMDVKVQRLPRVPRRERFEGDRPEALVAGPDA